MLKHSRAIVATATLAVAITGLTSLSGCSTTAASKDQPYALTGQPDPRTNPANYDTKGHFRPDWVAANSR